MTSTQKWVTLLSKCRKDPAFREKVNSVIDGIVDLINAGHNESSIKKQTIFSKSNVDILIEIARSRIKVSGKFSHSDRLWLDLYSASYSTPEIIGKYRASRIAGSRIVDVGSGAGLQAIMFAENTPVTGIETRRERVEMSYLNAEEYSVRDVKFINADYTAVIDNLKIAPTDVIFSDPLRAGSEEKRTLDSIVPSPLTLMSLASRFTGNFAFDLPPQMRWEEITIEGEKEYISIDGNMNRLTLYTGDLAHSRSSAVLLPSGMRVRGDPEVYSPEKTGQPGKYIYSPDPAVLYAKLVHSLPGISNMKTLTEDRRRLILTSDLPLEGEFPGEAFEILLTTTESNLLKDLEKIDAERCFLKFSISPDRYYQFKKMVDEKLSGEGTIYLFRQDDRYIIGKRVAFS